jgi:hypothetical protein
MTLWLLQPVDENDDRFSYDCAHGFVVRAATETTARRTVVDAREETTWVATTTSHPDGYPVTGQEGPDVWLDPTATTCTPINPDGEPTMILRDFLHG